MVMIMPVIGDKDFSFYRRADYKLLPISIMITNVVIIISGNNNNY